MITEAADWIYGIAAVMLFGTVVLQAVPEGTYQKYVRLFLGILWMVTVLSPLFSLFGLADGLRGSFLRDGLYAWMGKASVGDEWAEEALERRVSWIKVPLETLCGEYGFSCLDYEIEWNDSGDWPQMLTLWVTRINEDDGDGQEANDRVETVQVIRSIEQIGDVVAETAAYYEPSELRGLHQALADLWQLSKEQIRLYWQR